MKASKNYIKLNKVSIFSFDTIEVEFTIYQDREFNRVLNQKRLVDISFYNCSDINSEYQRLKTALDYLESNYILKVFK